MSAFNTATPSPISFDPKFVKFQLKTEKVDEVSCPKSPHRPTRTRCLTTGRKHIITSKNLNFKQSRQFDRCFQNHEIIGEGEHSYVYKAQSLSDLKFYAIKQLKKKFRGMKDREVYLNEVKKLALLSNGDTGLERYILKYLDSWEEEDYLYIRTELCLSNLKSVTGSTPTLPEPKLWEVLHEVCCGLKLIHSYGYAHLDVKPSNLFVAEKNVKVGDVGHMIEVGKEVVDEGDIAYVAPEVLQGKATFTSDIFSLGLVIFELATGVVMPERGELWNSLRSGCPPLDIIPISFELKQLLSRMLRVHPQDRITVDEVLSSHCTKMRSPPKMNLSGIQYKLQTAPPIFEIKEIEENSKIELAVNLTDIFNKL